MTLLQFQGVAADREQIKHRLGTTKIGAPEMLRCAKDLGLKARAYRSDWSRLAKTPLPAIAALRDGGFMVIAKAGEDKVLVQSPHTARPVLMTQAELLALWDGELILMTRRAGLSEMTRRFDITWFMGAIHKYRHLLGEVLVASFFLQMFALGLAAVLPGGDRQGSGAPRPEYAGCADYRPAGDIGFRDRSGDSADLSFRAHHQPH